MAAMLPFALVNWEVASKSAYAGLVLIGVFAAIAQMFYYKSFERAEASHVAPFGYSCVVFSGLFDWFFFQDIPDVWTVLGMILVIASGLWILRRSRSL
jgi:drug/metabolite transporter (DMT)-like permease